MSQQTLALSIRTASRRCARQMRGPSSLPAFLASQHRLLPVNKLVKCFWGWSSTRGSSVYSAPYRWKPWRWTVSLVRIKNMNAGVVLWGFVFTESVKILVIKQTLHLVDASKCVTIKPQVLRNMNFVCQSGRTAVPLCPKESLDYRAAILRSLGRGYASTVSHTEKHVVIRAATNDWNNRLYDCIVTCCMTAGAISSVVPDGVPTCTIWVVIFSWLPRVGGGAQANLLVERGRVTANRNQWLDARPQVVVWPTIGLEWRTVCKEQCCLANPGG